MSSIRGSTYRRMIFRAIILTFILLVKPTFAEQNQEEWKAYQREFAQFCQEKGISQQDLSVPKERETVVPEAGIRDLCMTCHMGIDSPLFADAREPFRTHPGKTLEQHPATKFGCTVCHQGNGGSLVKQEAHGRGENQSNPLIPTKHLQCNCIGCHETPYELEGAEKAEAGRLAFEKYACYACHRAAGFEDLPKYAPPHRDFKKKLLNTKWIISWLRNPRAMRPGTIMPDFKLGDNEIRDLAAFLLSLETEKEYPKVDLSAASADKGKEFFVELGCKACHSEKKEENSFRRHVPNLADAGVKLNPSWILEELKDPKAINPDARVPKLDIKEEDALSIIAYLTTLKANNEIVAGEKLGLEGASPENGKKLVEHYGCYGCHRIQGFEDAKIPSVDAAETAGKKPAELSFGAASINKTKWDWISGMIETPEIFQTEGRPLKKPLYKF
ncbi:MAG: c-type cytochrome, partial [bacterium]